MSDCPCRLWSRRVERQILQLGHENLACISWELEQICSWPLKTFLSPIWISHPEAALLALHCEFPLKTMSGHQTIGWIRHVAASIHGGSQNRSKRMVYRMEDPVKMNEFGASRFSRKASHVHENFGKVLILGWLDGHHSMLSSGSIYHLCLDARNDMIPTSFLRTCGLGFTGSTVVVTNLITHCMP